MGGCRSNTCHQVYNKLIPHNTLVSIRCMNVACLYV